jgi:acyl carrier protein
MHTKPESIENFVTSTISELVHRPQDEVVPETSLLDLGVDSLTITTLVAFIEAKYGPTLSAEQVTALFSATRVDEVLLALGHR